jgi:hypothetical protein
MQQTGHRRSLTHRIRLTAKHEKSGLKRILGAMFVLQNAPANAKDHRPMPFQQCRERQLVALGNKQVEQVRIGVAARMVRSDEGVGVRNCLRIAAIPAIGASPIYSATCYSAG